MMDVFIVAGDGAAGSDGAQNADKSFAILNVQS